MNPSTRKLTLTTHIIVSVGWIGAVLAYLGLVVRALSRQDDQFLHAAWIAMDLIGWYVIVPLALAALLTGFAIALGTAWGLFRHYWVVTSLFLTLVATAVLVNHMSSVTFFARLAVEGATADASGALRAALPGELLHAGLGLMVLLAIAALNVYKPRGLTAYGRSASQAVARSSTDDEDRAGLRPQTPTRTPRWVHAVWIHAVVGILLLAIVHLLGGGPGHR